MSVNFAHVREPAGRWILLTVDQAFPSLNTTTGRHWSHYRRQKKIWEKLIWVAKTQAGIHDRPTFARSKITIQRDGEKLLDPDNLVGGAKPLIDSLKVFGIIADDSPEHVKLTIEQRAGRTPRTMILVEET